METPPLKRTTHSSYRELLNTLEWREFSDRIRDEKGNSCQVCASEESLEVHHLGYRDNILPWEYPPHEVFLLCRQCHSNIHKWADLLWNEVLKSGNQWVIYECFKAVRQTLEKHHHEPAPTPQLPSRILEPKNFLETMPTLT